MYKEERRKIKNKIIALQGSEKVGRGAGLIKNFTSVI
jgi:hypothetical protein